ncbi:ABC transporter permease [Actinomadura sp. NPDC047616]|uniref:ABC transporter permease n=1 Tax=Actinomadura sp. NPDC047616 TaxID=3155914 RepID=UPI0033F067F1
MDLRRTVRDTRLLYMRHLRATLRARVAVVFGVLQPLLYLLLFGPLLTRLSGVRGFGDHDAWQVFVPGVLVQLALFSAGYVGFGLIADLRAGVVDRLRVTPVSRVALLLGLVLRDTTILAVQAVLLLAAGVALGLRAPVAGLAIGVTLVVLLAVGIASLSYVLALVTRQEDGFAPLLGAVVLPLMLLSGMLLPMSMAPGWLDVASHFTPFRYVVDAVRAAFVGDYASATVAEGAAVTTVLVMVSVTLGTRRFLRENA